MSMNDDPVQLFPVPKSGRKPRARHRDVVIGAIYERITMIQGNVEHTIRLRELLDELKRASAQKESDE